MVNGPFDAQCQFSLSKTDESYVLVTQNDLKSQIHKLAPHFFGHHFDKSGVLAEAVFCSEVPLSVDYLVFKVFVMRLL